MVEIHVVGTVHSGKTTFARVISKLLGALDIKTEIVDDDVDWNVNINNEAFSKIDLLKLITIIEDNRQQPIIIRTISAQKMPQF